TQQAITVLSQIGARSFLIINTPDIGLIPETRLIATATTNPAFVSYATALSQSYNKQLHRMLENFEAQKNIKLMTSDLYKLFNKIMKKAGKLGFTNSNDACFSRITFTFHPDCNYGLNADKFIFFDEIHPTARVHKIFGDAFYDDLTHERYEHHGEH
ncbi:MAG: SGNH/GDSL hydrolase family protein, partial [Gammaproteobacteria bacterium]|nr:SGNH/GDSL hydrolase family protein [Gammaproteobacteria bacterium]